MESFFITSSGTDIGKTFVTTTLCRQIRELGRSVHAIKPVISGFGNEDYESEHGNTNDIIEILKSLELPATKENIDKVSCYRFSAPLSPDMAANREGIKIDFNKIKDFCNSFSNKYDYLLIEGVGGAMVPLTDKKTTIDLIEQIGFKTLLVVGNYLGSISHTLTTFDCLKKRNIEVKSVIVSESENPAATLEETISTLKNFIDVPITPLPRFDSSNNILKAIK